MKNQAETKILTNNDSVGWFMAQFGFGKCLAFIFLHHSTELTKLSGRHFFRERYAWYSLRGGRAYKYVLLLLNFVRRQTTCCVNNQESLSLLCLACFWSATGSWSVVTAENQGEQKAA